MKDEEFKVFSGPANDPASRVVALKIPEAEGESKAQELIWRNILSDDCAIRG